MLGTVLAAIPAPPLNDMMPKTAETVFNVFIFIPLGIFLALAIREIVKGRGPILLYCILGGALAASFEPIVDVLGLVFMKERHALGVFTILGRTMPLYICFVYAWYVGGLGYFCYRLFKRGMTTRGLFGLWAIIGLVDVLLETPGILLHTYLYYGHQPFDIWGFPLWWGFVNPVMPLLAGALIYKTEPYLPGWRLAVVILFIPMADGVANAAAGSPMWIALNQSDVPYVWTYLAGLMTLGLSLLCVWLISLAVARLEHELADETVLEKLRAAATGARSLAAVPS
jgi:hypothetical protein